MSKMYLISKNGTDIYNFDHITELFISNTDGSIRANFANNARYEIERYDRREDAILAIQIISEKIGKQDVIYTPTPKELQAYRARTHDTQERASNGKKTVRRGGS